jgi:hypothetical protein
MEMFIILKESIGISFKKHLNIREKSFTSTHIQIGASLN